MKMIRILSFFGFMITLGVFFSACSDDNGSTDPDPNPDSVEPEATSAWLYDYYLSTPEGRIHYMDAVEELPSNVDVDGSVELGLNARTYAIGENVYTLSPSAGTLTRWDVDRTTLEISPSGLISYASTGAGNGSADRAVFYSETQAYLPNFTEGVIVEIDPTEMRITKVHNIPPVLDAPIDGVFVSQSEGDVIHDKVICTLEVSMNQCCEYNVPPGGAIVAVLDPASSAFQYNKDQRSLASDRIVLYDENGTGYVQPSRNNGFMGQYHNGVPSGPGLFTLLKLDENGNFDSDFNVDLSEGSSINWYGRAATIFDNKVILTYANFEWPDSWDERWSFYGDETAFNTISLDLETKEVRPFTIFDDFIEVLYINTIDGTNYFTGFGADSSKILRQNGFEDYTEVLINAGGGILTLEKLW